MKSPSPKTIKKMLANERAAELFSALEARIVANDFLGAKSAAQPLLKLTPHDPRCWWYLGLSCLNLDEYEAAAKALGKAGKLAPKNGHIWEQLGVALCGVEDYSLALRYFEKSLSLAPIQASTWNNAAHTANQLGQFARAENFALRALELDPSIATYHSNYANSLRGLGRMEEAIASYQRAATLAPSLFNAHLNLGITLNEINQYDAAVESYQRALTLNPEHVGTHKYIADIFYMQGKLAQAAAHYRQIIELEPNNYVIHSNLLFCLAHNHHISPQQLFAEHIAYGKELQSSILPTRIDENSRGPISHDTISHDPIFKDPMRRLRVGFVSGDLRHHVLAFFLAPVWAAIDPAQIEIVAYSCHPDEDVVSQHLRALCHHWRQVADIDDETLAAQIRADEIDILFDLAGHTALNRLPVFARKPAPVQVTWLGYPNTSGLIAMDYVLCDNMIAPHGLYEHFYVEKFARIPSSATFNYTGSTPPVNALPALSNGYITFASFNRVSKLSDEVIAVWSQVLRTLDTAKLLLGGISDTAICQQLIERFGHHGITPERITFRPRVSEFDFLEAHHGVDIILDTWPYTGGTTTNHALSMGVPVITLLGPSRAHCQSAAILSRVGLEDWVASNTDDFVKIAIQWAQTTQELAQLRATLRKRLELAPLRMPLTVARGLEQAVRVMWQRWCKGLPAEHFELTQLANSDTLT